MRFERGVVGMGWEERDVYVRLPMQPAFISQVIFSP